MPKLRLSPVFLSLIALGSGGALANPALGTVAVCDDVAEWPPFTYRERDARGQAQAKVVGYSVEVLRRILAPQRITLKVELLPWVRCLREVESGQQFQMALNASFSPEREARFLLSQPYYETTHTYFYSRKVYPRGLQLRDVADLTRYHICGVHGYNYSAYGLSDEQVDRGALDFSRVIAKLHAGRCEIGIEKLEAVAGFKRLGRDLLADPDLGHAPIPGLARGEFHMLISRQHPQGEALRALIDRGLKALRESGELRELRQRYLS
ncbi:MAG: transporter substrate-binding domain-containing protein [Inhella sp.]